MSSREYAEHIANNTVSMIREVTTNPDGSTRGMPAEVTAGVLAAQSNLAIAAALMWLASELKESR